MIDLLHHRPQRGEGKIGCIFWTLALVFFGYVAWQGVPVKMKTIDLEQFVVRQAESASLQGHNTVRQLTANILRQAEELDLPLEKDNLEVTRNGSRIRVKAHYTVPINLFVTTYDWVIRIEVERRMMRI